MFARELQSQFNAATAQAILGSIGQTFTAAGTSQATAAAIVSPWTNITTGTEGQGAVLPSGLQPSDSGMICNSTTASLYIYPPVGGKINNSTVNIPMMLAPNVSLSFVCIDGTSYMVNR